MKRSPLKRTGGPKTNPDKVREWQQRSRRELPARSRKRIADASDRVLTRAAVVARAGGRCEYADIMPEVACGTLPGRGMEVDELRGGSWRQAEWLDPDWCRLTCPVHHDYKTEHKRVILARLGVAGYA
jgi:hypothetical protein